MLFTTERTEIFIFYEHSIWRTAKWKLLDKH